MNRFYTVSIILFVLVELSGFFLIKILSPLITTAVLRGIQLMLFLIICNKIKLTNFFFGYKPYKATLNALLILFFSGATFLITILTAKYFFNFHILKLMLFKLPKNYSLLLLAGGIIGPVAEEFLFRGIIYNLIIKKQNKHIAVLLSALIFSFFHLGRTGLPVIQFAGGIIFAYSYSYSKNLISPIIIHCTGNIAIFSIPFFYKIFFLKQIFF